MHHPLPFPKPFCGPDPKFPALTMRACDANRWIHGRQQEMDMRPPTTQQDRVDGGAAEILPSLQYVLIQAVRHPQAVGIQIPSDSALAYFCGLPLPSIPLYSPCLRRPRGRYQKDSVCFEGRAPLPASQALRCPNQRQLETGAAKGQAQCAPAEKDISAASCASTQEAAAAAAAAIFREHHKSWRDNDIAVFCATHTAVTRVAQLPRPPRLEPSP